MFDTTANLHKHCNNCFNSKCNSQLYCDVIECPNRCHSKFHSCKMNEHLNEICENSFVECYNNIYGCKFMLKRRELREHLLECPANVVECGHRYYRRFKTTSEDLKENINNSNGNSSSSTENTFKISKNETVNELYLSRDKDEFKSSAASKKHQFNSSYRHLIPDEQSSLMNALASNNNLNKLKSKIFEDIEIDHCPFFDDELGCKACQKLIHKLELDRHKKLTADLKFSDILKSVYSYQEFLSRGIYATPKFLALYDQYYTKSEPSNDITVEESQEKAENIVEEFNEKILNKISLAEEITVKSDNTIVDIDDIRFDEKIDQFNRHKFDYFTHDCGQLLRQCEYADHYKFEHNFLEPLSGEIDAKCPLHNCGCTVSFMKYRFYSKDVKQDGLCGQLGFNSDTKKFAIKYIEGHNEEKCYLQELTDYPLFKIFSNLDSHSFYCLSLTSKFFREMCSQFIEDKGIVYPKWEKISYLNEDGKREVNWREKYVWSFTKHVEAPKIKTCFIDGDISRHLMKCEFNKTNMQTEKFTYHIAPENCVLKK